MNARERVLRAIDFRSPDRAPFSYSVIRSALLDHGQRLVDLCHRCPNDFFDPVEVVKPATPDRAHVAADGTYRRIETNDWGCQVLYLRDGIAGEVIAGPLDDWSKLADFRIPDPVPGDRAAAAAAMRRQKERFVGWAGLGTFFVKLQELRGSENFLVDLAEDAPELHVLADRILDEYLIPQAVAAVEAGADIVAINDDIGTTRGPMVGPELWRHFFAPRYRRLWDAVHAGGARTLMHSCGDAAALVEDYIASGADILQLQIALYDKPALKAQCAGRCCLFACIDQSAILQHGTPADIRAHIEDVRTALDDPAGGFILGTAIVEDTPFENIEALFAAAYGG